METNERYIIAPPRFSSTNAETVAPVGTGELSMSSSSNIEDDLIPDCVREIFDNPAAEDWFVVYYLTRDKKVIAKHAFLFKGRDKSYRQKCVSAADGIFRYVYIIFKGQTARYHPAPEYSLKEVTMGQEFFMSIKGEIIP
jgi:hypothetical protein